MKGKATGKAARRWCSPSASRDAQGVPENSVLTEVNHLLPDLQDPELFSLCSLKKALHYSCENKKINRDMSFYPSSSSSSD